MISLYPLFTHLTAPPRLPPPDRRRAQLLSMLLLINLFLAALSIPLALLQNNDLPPVLLAIGVLAIAYALSRTRLYRLGSVVAIIMLGAAPVLFILSDSQFDLPHVLRLIEWGVLALPLIYTLFALRGVLVYLLLSTGALLLLPWLMAVSPVEVLPAAKLLVSVGVLVGIFGILSHVLETERQAMEATLRENEADYRRISEMLTDVAFVTDVSPQGEHSLRRVIGAVNAITGLTEAEIQRTSLRPYVHPDDLPFVLAREARLKRGEQDVSEFRLKLRAGDIRWVRVYSSVAMENGRVTHIYGAMQDITEQKEHELAEAEQHRLTDALRATVSAISSTLDLDAVLDKILEQVLQVIPTSGGDIRLIEGDIARVVRTRNRFNTEIEDNLSTFVIGETDNLRRILETGQPVIIPDVRAYPDWIHAPSNEWIRAFITIPIRLEGETIGFLSLGSEKVDAFNARYGEPLRLFADQVAIAIRNARLYDERRRYAEGLEAEVRERTSELELERQRLKVILDATGEGIFYTEGSVIQYTNPAMCALVGYTTGELVGQSRTILRDLQGEPEQKLQSITGVLNGGKVWRNELRLRRKDGSLFDAGLTVSLVGGVEGATRAVHVVRDISAEKALQLQRSNLVAHASHELRTPITNLKTRIYLMRRQPEQLDAHLRVLEEVTERMRRLVSDLLDMSRLEHGQIPLEREPLALQSLVGRVVQVQQPEAEHKNLSLTLDAPPDVLTVYADPERLTQVVTNLLTNAINYTPEGGAIRVVITRLDNSVCISIHDTGIGIAPDDLLLIFEPFFRVVSSVQGSGLGLSIARQIVEMHGGSLTVESQPGQGSTFYVTLSLFNPSSSPASV